jgi:hypothetical protein
MAVYDLKTYQDIQAINYAIETYKIDMMALLAEHPVMDPACEDYLWFCFMADTVKSLSEELERLKHGKDVPF